MVFILAEFKDKYFPKYLAFVKKCNAFYSTQVFVPILQDLQAKVFYCKKIIEKEFTDLNVFFDDDNFLVINIEVINIEFFFGLQILSTRIS